jgi:hypothetical protein
MVRELDDGLKRSDGERGTVILLVMPPGVGIHDRVCFDDISCLSEYKQVCFLQMDVDKNPETKKTLKVERYLTLCCS